MVLQLGVELWNSRVLYWQVLFLYLRLSLCISATSGIRLEQLQTNTD